MLEKDSRVKLLNEVLGGIKVFMLWIYDLLLKLDIVHVWKSNMFAKSKWLTWLPTKESNSKLKYCYFIDLKNVCVGASVWEDFAQ